MGRFVEPCESFEWKRLTSRWKQRSLGRFLRSSLRIQRIRHSYEFEGRTQSAEKQSLRRWRKCTPTIYRRVRGIRALLSLLLLDSATRKSSRCARNLQMRRWRQCLHFTRTSRRLGSRFQVEARVVPISQSASLLHSSREAAPTCWHFNRELNLRAFGVALNEQSDSSFAALPHTCTHSLTHSLTYTLIHLFSPSLPSDWPYWNWRKLRWRASFLD